MEWIFLMHGLLSHHICCEFSFQMLGCLTSNIMKTRLKCDEPSLAMVNKHYKEHFCVVLV